MIEKIKVITLCGPIRFEDWFKVVAAELTLKGYIVLGPNVWGLHQILHDDQKQAWRSAKYDLDVLHQDKIRMSQAIFVIDPLNYIGDSTKKEIDFALLLKKKVFYWSQGDLENV